MAAVYVEPVVADFWQLARDPGGKYLDEWGPQDCTTHSMSRAIMRHYEGVQPSGTAGAWPPSGEFVRSVSRNRDGTLDRDGGNNLDQMAAIGRQFYGFGLDVRKALPFADFIARIAAGRGAIVQLWYQPIRATAFRGSTTFSGNHSIFVSGVDTSRDVFTNVVDPLADGRRAGLFHGPGDYPIPLLKDAAGRLDVGPPGTYRALGAGLVNAGLTQPTGSPPLQPPDWTAHFAAGATVRIYSLDSSGCISRWADSIWGPNASRAPCTGPASRRTCDGASSATTVRITAGVFAGKTIRIGREGVSATQD